MNLLSGNREEAPSAAPERVEEETAPAPSFRHGPWGLLPEVAAAVALGVLLVSVGYAGGRSSASWADWAYWAGQALLVVPVAWRVFVRRATGRGEALGIAMVVAVASYVVKVCYSPLQFTFPDELVHWRAAVNQMSSGTLLSPNYALPVAPHYPGLENVTTALASVTGLPLFQAGLIVAGLAHLLLVVGILVLVQHISRSPRIALTAVLIYATEPHFASFDAMFIYQALALAFFALTLVAAQRLSAPARPGQPPHRAAWATVAVVMLAATVITHHVTSFALIGALAVIAAVSWPARGLRAALAPGLLAFLGTAMAVGWVVGFAPGTLDYLTPAWSGISRGIGALFSGVSDSGRSPTTPIPLLERGVSYASVLVVAALLPVGWRVIWRRQRDNPWALAFAVGAGLFYVAIVLRLLAEDGSEWAGRLLTFALIPASYVAARALHAGILRTIHRRAAAVVAVVAVAVLYWGAIVNGWPPRYERLPGPYQVSGYERSVDAEGIGAAEWSLQELGPGNRMATDFSNYALQGAIGWQDVLRDVSPLYFRQSFNASDITLVGRSFLRFVLVDHRDSTGLPVSGKYVPDDPEEGRHTTPLPRAALDKYDTVPGISRVFDSGDIVVYDLAGSAYAP